MTERKIKMSLDLGLDVTKAKASAGVFGAAVKTAISTATIAGVGVAMRAPEVRGTIAGVFGQATAKIREAFAGSNIPGIVGFAGRAAAGVGRFAWNHPRITGAALGGLAGGIPGALSGAAPTMGRYASSAIGAGVGGALLGPLGAVGGAAGGLMGGAGGAVMGVAAAGAATAIFGLGAAAIKASGKIAEWVSLTDPHTARELNKAWRDLYAVLGDSLKPIVVSTTGVIRSWADALYHGRDAIKLFADAAAFAAGMFKNPFETARRAGVMDRANARIRALDNQLGQGRDDQVRAQQKAIWERAAKSAWGATEGFAASGAARFETIEGIGRSVQLAAAQSGGPVERMAVGIGRIDGNTERILESLQIYAERQGNTDAAEAAKRALASIRANQR